MIRQGIPQSKGTTQPIHQWIDSFAYAIQPPYEDKCNQSLYRQLGGNFIFLYFCFKSHTRSLLKYLSLQKPYPQQQIRPIQGFNGQKLIVREFDPYKYIKLEQSKSNHLRIQSQSISQLDVKLILRLCEFIIGFIEVHNQILQEFIFNKQQDLESQLKQQTQSHKPQAYQNQYQKHKTLLLNKQKVEKKVTSKVKDKELTTQSQPQKYQKQKHIQDKTKSSIADIGNHTSTCKSTPRNINPLSSRSIREKKLPISSSTLNAINNIKPRQVIQESKLNSQMLQASRMNFQMDERSPQKKSSPSPTIKRSLSPIKPLKDQNMYPQSDAINMHYQPRVVPKQKVQFQFTTSATYKELNKSTKSYQDITRKPQTTHEKLSSDIESTKQYSISFFSNLYYKSKYDNKKDDNQKAHRESPACSQATDQDDVRSFSQTCHSQKTFNQHFQQKNPNDVMTRSKVSFGDIMPQKQTLKTPIQARQRSQTTSHQLTIKRIESLQDQKIRLNLLTVKKNLNQIQSRQVSVDSKSEHNIDENYQLSQFCQQKTLDNSQVGSLSNIEVDVISVEKQEISRGLNEIILSIKKQENEETDTTTTPIQLNTKPEFLLNKDIQEQQEFFQNKIFEVNKESKSADGGEREKAKAEAEVNKLLAKLKRVKEDEKVPQEGQIKILEEQVKVDYTIEIAEVKDILQEEKGQYDVNEGVQITEQKVTNESIEVVHEDQNDKVQIKNVELLDVMIQPEQTIDFEEKVEIKVLIVEEEVIKVQAQKVQIIEVEVQQKVIEAQLKEVVKTKLDQVNIKENINADSKDETIKTELEVVNGQQNNEEAKQAECETLILKEISQVIEVLKKEEGIEKVESELPQKEIEVVDFEQVNHDTETTQDVEKEIQQDQGQEEVYYAGQEVEEENKQIYAQKEAENLNKYNDPVNDEVGDQQQLEEKSNSDQTQEDKIQLKQEQEEQEVAYLENTEILDFQQGETQIQESEESQLYQPLESEIRFPFLETIQEEESDNDNNSRVEELCDEDKQQSEPSNINEKIILPEHQEQNQESFQEQYQQNKQDQSQIQVIKVQTELKDNQPQIEQPVQQENTWATYLDYYRQFQPKAPKVVSNKISKIHAMLMALDQFGGAQVTKKKDPYCESDQTELMDLIMQRPDVKKRSRSKQQFSLEF